MQPCFRVETSWCRWYQGAWLGKSASHVGRVVLVTAHRDAGTPREGIHAWDRGTSISEGRLLGSWKAPRNEKSVVEFPSNKNQLDEFHGAQECQNTKVDCSRFVTLYLRSTWIVEQDADVSTRRECVSSFLLDPKITKTQPTFGRMTWSSMFNVL